MAKVKIDIGDFVFDKTAKTITFTGISFDTISQISVIVDSGALNGAATDIFNPARGNSRSGVLSVGGTVLTLNHDTNNANYIDDLLGERLIICYEQHGTIQRHGLQVSNGSIETEQIIQIGARSAGIGKQFSDVCDFTELSTLDYDGGTIIPVAGLDLTGGTSGATARIVIVDGDATSGTLTLRKVDGDFLDNEPITDSGTGSALANGTQSRIREMTDPTGAEQYEVVCENLNDTFGGTGVNLILVTYLDSVTRQYVTEVVATGGHTPVLFAATNQFFPRDAACIAFGAQTPEGVLGKTNLGAVIIRDSATKQIRTMIAFDDSVVGDAHGRNLSQSIHYMVPNGWSLFFDFTFTNPRKGNDGILNTAAKFAGSENYLLPGETSVYQSDGQEDFSAFPAQGGIPEGVILKSIAKSTNEDTVLTAQIIGTLKRPNT
jgi:hypothetical protein